MQPAIQRLADTTINSYGLWQCDSIKITLVIFLIYVLGVEHTCEVLQIFFGHNIFGNQQNKIKMFAYSLAQIIILVSVNCARIEHPCLYKKNSIICKFYANCVEHVMKNRMKTNIVQIFQQYVSNNGYLI